jgi:hypothetical protein
MINKALMRNGTIDNLAMHSEKFLETYGLWEGEA